jgi:hypothetical protein
VTADFKDQTRASGRRYSEGLVLRFEKHGGFMSVGIGVLDFLFGCHHAHLSRVFTLGGETYRVCFECGAKFEYSLESMSIERRCPPAPVIRRFRIA